MRPALLLLAASLPLLGSCAAFRGPAASRFQEGAWRVGLSVGTADDTALNDADQDLDNFALDLGQILGPSGEIGVRFAGGEIQDADVETASVGVYGRWYFAPDWRVRPFGELGAGLAGIEIGGVEETGWDFSAAIGAAWYLTAGLGVEAFLRNTHGNYESSEIFTTDLGVGLSLLF
jgi:hypothetical protein